MPPEPESRSGSVPILDLLKVGIPVVAIVVGAAMMIFTLGYGTREPTPEQLAMVETTPPAADIDDPDWCAQPQPVPSIPALSTEIGNAALAHEAANGNFWTASTYRGLRTEDWADDVSLPDEATAEYRAVICIDRVADGSELTCAGYEGGARATIWGYDSVVTVYEAASAEPLGSFTVENKGGLRCPQIVLGDEVFQPGPLPEWDITREASGMLSPVVTRYDAYADLAAEWCGAPTPMTASQSEVFAVIVDSGGLLLVDALEITGVGDSTALPSHVLCAELTELGRLDCPSRTDIVEVPVGDVGLRFVDASTGSAVAETVLPSATDCPPASVTPKWPRPGAEATAWIVETMAVLATPAADPADGTAGD